MVEHMKWYGWGREDVAFSHEDKPSLAPFVAKVVGAGPLADRLQDLVRDRGLSEHVQLLGGRGQDELPDLYRWADVFCLPSSREGVPVVLMEAMATELPVVTTPVAGIPELVTSGLSGLFVPPGDADAVAAALSELAGDRDRRALLGRAGRQTVLREFTAGPNAGRLLDCFSTVVRPRVGTGRQSAPTADDA